MNKSKKKLKIHWDTSSLAGTLTVLVVIGIFAALGIGIVFLDKYVRKTTPPRKTIAIELADVPYWVNDQLKELVYTSIDDSSVSKLDENTAVLARENIVQRIAWLADVTVQTTHNGLRIAGRWRKPLAIVKSGLRKSYVDDEQVVLDFLPMPTLPIVEVKGLTPMTKIPQPGEVWQRDDLAAAVAIISRLDRMDELTTPGKPLLYEIDSINVSNSNGRKSTSQPHVVLHTKDGTEVIWGAELGAWAQHLEATDEDKLAKLYGYYKEYGSLEGRAKYINLRDPQDKIPLPIDKY